MDINRAGLAPGSETVDCADTRDHEVLSSGGEPWSGGYRALARHLREIEIAASQIQVQGARGTGQEQYS